MIKIVTWNIRRALGTDGITDIIRVGNLLKSFNADIYAVQEIDINVERSDYINQVEVLEGILGMKGHFAKFWEIDEGEYGLATFSSLSFVNSQPIKVTELKQNNAILLSRFKVRNSLFDFVNLHAPRFHKATYWKNFNKDYDFSDCILCGDFNLKKEDKVLIDLKENYNYINEANTWDRGEVLDYTFVPKKSFKLLSQMVYPSGYSDHDILITTIDLW